MDESIREEFERLSQVDYKDNYSIGEVYGYMGAIGSFTDEDNNAISLKPNRGFVVVGKKNYSTNFRIKKDEQILLFAKKIVETGNLKYAKSVSGIGYELAHRYINLLNDEAVSRGLPLIFKKKKIRYGRALKLNEKQVSYIKYLVDRFPAKKIAEMYGVSQGYIYAIKSGVTRKEIKPAILTISTKVYKNQCSPIVKIKEVWQLPQETVNDIGNEEYVRAYFRSIRWPDGNIHCPYCENLKCYIIENGRRYKCANNECYKKFTFLVGTKLQSSNIALWLWVKAVKHYVLEKDVSSYSMALELGTPQKTGYRVLKLLRNTTPKQNIEIKIEDLRFYMDGIFKTLLSGNKKSGIHESA